MKYLFRKGFEGRWEVLFDGNWIEPIRRLSPEDTDGYFPGTILETTKGSFFQPRWDFKTGYGWIQPDYFEVLT